MSEKKSSGAGRTRNYATVVYPESASTDWLEKLSELHVPAFVSPLHDKDVNPTGESKKAHYHVMIMFEGVKTLDQAREAVGSFGGVGCETVNSQRGYARYLCHLDNPEKYQYSPEDVRSFGGADYIASIGLPTDKYKAIGEMLDYCCTEGIYDFATLLEYARAEHYDWFRVLCASGAVIMEKYLKSSFWRSKQRDQTTL